MTFYRTVGTGREEAVPDMNMTYEDQPGISRHYKHTHTNIAKPLVVRTNLP